MDEPGSAYPVLFTLHEIVSGNGFLASVTVKGRGSMVQEDDGAWWLYGVQPGGMSQTGNTPQEAHLKFAADFRDVLFDLASDASDFRNFEKLVTNFLCQVNDPEELRWTEAVAAIRAGRVPQDQFLSSLPRLRAESKCGVIVQRLDRTAHHKAKDNKSNTLALPLAAQVSSRGVVLFKDVLAMLDACASGYGHRVKKHRNQITHNSKTSMLSLGEHGSGSRAEIQVGALKHMIRHLGISMECAKTHLPILKQQKHECPSQDSTLVGEALT